MQRQKITNSTSVNSSLHELQEVHWEILGSNTHAKYCSFEPGLRVRHIYFREKSGNFLRRCGAFRLSVSLTPSFHVSGKPRKGLGFHCFLTYPKFPIPPICRQPPQRYRPFDFEQGYSDFTKKISCRRFRAKKNLARNTCHTMALCVRGKTGEKKYYQIPHPYPPPPLKSQMVGLLK